MIDGRDAGGAHTAAPRQRLKDVPRNTDRSTVIGLSAFLAGVALVSQAAEPTNTLPTAQGQFFNREKYTVRPLPKFDAVRDQLPGPVLDGKPLWIQTYWKAWELASRNFHESTPASGFLSQFIDAAFNQNIFLWDTCFLTMFCNCAHPLVPGIGSLDNFYVKQHADGEICREIDRQTGADYAEWINCEGKPLFSRWGWAGTHDDPVIYRGRELPQPASRLTLDALNHPILAWAELESFRFFFDLKLDGERAPVRTIAAYWMLLAKVADQSQAADLVRELSNPVTFGRAHRVPTLAADEPGYDPAGGYWRGAVWAPTDTMVIRGLENYGYFDLAREIALEHLDRVAEVFHQTGTIWENYAPDSVHQGKPAKGDFVGWSGIGPILYLLEYAIGLKPNALRNELTWELHADARVGCDRYRFNGHVIDVLGTPIGSGKGWEIAVRSDGQFTLRLQASGQMKRIAVEPGNTRVTILP